MKIAIIGSTGTIGQRIVKEALERGHQVTAIVRDTAKATLQDANLSIVVGDILKADSIAAAVTGHDVVISAYGPQFGAEATLIEATQSLIDGVKQSGTRRLITVGGAGSLEVAPGLQLVDTPAFPDAWKPIGLAHRDALGVLRSSDVNWTNVSPAALIEPGERTGAYRTGKDSLLANEQGESRISAEDYAVALLDEAEKPQHICSRFTVAY